jgi:hypothetical protein
LLGVIPSANSSVLSARKVQQLSATVEGKKKTFNTLTATTTVAPQVTVNVLS